jgi:hypothetical protein
LLAARVSLFDCREEFFGENFRAALTREDLAHVNYLGSRHRSICDSSWKMKIVVLAASGVVKRFERRCCRAKHYDSAFAISAHNANVAPVVIGRLLLAIRGLVLFVNYDQTKILDGREDCGACAYDYARKSALQTTPFIETLARCQRGVKDCDLIAKMCA